MKIIYTTIICFSLLACNNNMENKKSKFDKQNSEKFEINENSSFKILADLDTYEQYQLVDKSDNSVFIYTKEGTTFVDEVNYETDYTELVIFEFNPELESFDYFDEEISNLNCVYQWRAESKLLKKETVKIEYGNISGKQINSETWEISINIDPKFSFGGYFDKSKAHKITFKVTVKTTKR